MLASRYNVFHTAACQPKQAAALASSNLYILISIDETNLLGRSNGMIDLNFVLKEETMSGTRTYDPKTRKKRQIRPKTFLDVDEIATTNRRPKTQEIRE